MTVKEFNKRVEFNGGCDRIIGSWNILDIHEIPQTMKEYHEVDFYCCNNKIIVLLRLRNRANEKYEIVNDRSVIPYWIAELPITEINNKLIEKILEKFELEISGSN